MGCVLAKNEKGDSSGAYTRRPSWRMNRLHNKSIRMAAIRQREAELQQLQLPPGSRRSSVANAPRGMHVVCPEPTAAYDFCSPKRDGPDDADYLSQMDCLREQKRNEFEDYGTSPHLTLDAFDRLEFGLTPMDNAQDVVF